jgi:hypothetical protein
MTDHHQHDQQAEYGAIRSLMAMTARPEVWRVMQARHWLKLGRMMTEIVDEDAERARIRESYPAWADQIDAASDEALALAGLPLGGAPIRGELNIDQAAEWALRGQVVRVLAGLASKCLTGCPHADLYRPRPLFAASWGNRVDCRACLASHEQPDPSWVEARTCDLCGRVQREPTRLATPTIGMLTVGLGVCTRCVRRMGVAR